MADQTQSVGHTVKVEEYVDEDRIDVPVSGSSDSYRYVIKFNPDGSISAYRAGMGFTFEDLQAFINAAVRGKE